MMGGLFTAFLAYCKSSSWRKSISAIQNGVIVLDKSLYPPKWRHIGWSKESRTFKAAMYPFQYHFQLVSSALITRMVTGCFACTSTTSPSSNSVFEFDSNSSAPKQPRIMFAPFTGDRVRRVVYCFRCSKPRCIYAQKQLSTRERILLDQLITNCVFSCGSPLLPPLHPLEDRISMKMFRSCEAPVELAFYSSHLDSINVCSYCGTSEGDLSEEVDLSRRHPVTLPICGQCKLVGRQARSLLPVKRTELEREDTE